MCTASHNPKAYTGAKLVERGRRRAVGRRRHPGHPAPIEAGLGDAAAAAARSRRSTSTPDFQRARSQFIDPAAVAPLQGRARRRQRHGRADGRPDARALGLDLVTTYWEPDGDFPDHEPNPLLEENRRFIIDKVRAEGADLGIAWDGDADRCFFIDDTGAFVDGDFLTALLAESVLAKQPGADILYDVRASRAVADTVERLGGRAHVNRVGHAFFKRRMRDEGGAFGGEVSGHYYFADFYNADSGTIPALLILELLSKQGAHALRAARAAARALLHLAARSTPRSPTRRPRWRRSSERYGDGEITKLDGISVDYDDWHFNVRPSNTEPLLRLCLESLVSRAGHGAPARRGARPDPLVTVDPPPADPDAVRRRPRQLLPDRGRPADAGRLRAELGQGARRARAGAGRARPPDRGPRADRHHPPAHRPPRAGRDPRPPLGRRGGALDLLAPVLEEFGADAERDDELAEALMLRHGIPRDVVTALRVVSRAFRAWGGSAQVDRRLADGEALEFAGRTLQACTGPGTRRRTRVFWDDERRRADRRRPPDQAHLLQPADLAAARRQVGRAGRRPPARAAHLPALAARDARDADRDRAARPRRRR